MQIITIATQKGGEGKTTTAAALASGLTLKGYRVLAIDLDPQKSLTYIFGGTSEGATVLDVLTGKSDAQQAIQQTSGGDLIAGHAALTQIDPLLGDDIGKQFRLKKALQPLAEKYDYVVLDTPPALGTLTANALTACNSLIIPAQADISSLQGIAQIWKTVKGAREYINPELSIAGILLTRFNDRATLNRDIRKQLDETIAPALGTKLFQATIREAVAVREAKYKQIPLFKYAPKANVTEDYLAFIDEFLATEQTKRRP
jgi:chromosome partitioning protein